MPKNKLSALLSLLLVFLSGTLVGAVSYRLYMVNTVSTATNRPPRLDPEEIRKRRVTEMRQKLQLDENQVGKLNEIYDHTRQEFQALKKKGDEEGHGIWEKQKESVRAILRPEQQPLYEQYQKEQDEQRRRHQEKEGKK
jgi:uncharacterized membrane protein